MLTVSDGFAAAIAAPSRLTRARVRLEVLDTKAWLDNVKEASSQAPISRLHQVTNRVREPAAALATFEPDYWRLDGSFVLPPEPGELPDAELGWWSEAICDEQGLFSPMERLSITCGALYNAAGITVTFDPAANEYAEEFAITAYGGADEVICSVVVTGNTSPTYRLNRVIPQFRRVDLLISKWAQGNRRARVMEVDFGLIEDYGEDKLVDLSLVNELDPASASLPVGELRFRLDNSDRRFNILNPEGLHYFLQLRQRVTVDMGVEVDGRLETVPAGTYYLNEWKSDQGTLTASFVARDLLDLLSQGRYRRGRLEAVTAYDLAADILEDAGVLEYGIDSALQDVHLSGAVPLLSHRDALQLVAVASQAVVRVDNRGRPIIERLPASGSVATIGLDNTFSAPSITLDPLVGAIDVEVCSFEARGSVEVYAGVIDLSGTSEVWLEYSSPCRGHQVSIDGGVLEGAEHFAYSSRLMLTGNGAVSVRVTAEELAPVKTVHALQDTSATNGEPAQTLLVSNPLINTPALAHGVATWLLTQAKQRLSYEIDWRQNPAIECGDLVTVEDEFGANRMARVCRQEIEFSGYISGRTRAKGGG